MKAMILAAGRGERMRPLTDHTPKPLLQVAGKPLIAWHIERLAKAGFVDIVINHAHLGAQIEATLGTGQSFGVRIHYSAETPPALETAGGIAKALPYLGETPFAVINGDIFTDYPMHTLAQTIRNWTGAYDAHLVLINNPEHNPQGDFCLHEGLILGNQASPDSPLFVKALTFSGIGIYHPTLFAHIPHNTPAKLAPLLRQSAAVGRLAGEHYSGNWLDVGTPARLDDANQAAKQWFVHD